MKPIVLVASITFKPEFTAIGREALKELHVNTHTYDSGCLQYDLHVNETDEHTFTVIETWQDEKALDRHTNAHHFLEFMALIEGKTVAMSLEKMNKIS